MTLNLGGKQKASHIKIFDSGKPYTVKLEKSASCKNYYNSCLKLIGNHCKHLLKSKQTSYDKTFLRSNFGGDNDC